jgi:murein L,D-transpeptidase YcbB/YkuD
MTRPFLVPTPVLATLVLAALALTAGAEAKPRSSAPPAAAPAQPPLPLPTEQTITAAVAALPADDPLRSFYTAHRMQPAWSRADAKTLLAALADADRQALNPRDFLGDLETERDPASRDLKLTRAALAYGAALAMGRVNPESVEEIFTLKRNVVDIPGGLEDALTTHRLQAWLDALPPNDRGYAGLSKAYLHYRGIAIQGGWPTFQVGDKISPGDTDPRIPALVTRLVLEGDLEQAVPGDVYSDPIVEAMRRFQGRHGLNNDGVIGEDTQEELQATAEDRARMIATNMERRRWLSRVLAPERIDVNTAATILTYWKDGQPVRAMRVINGKRTTQTPSLEAAFSTVLANPPWSVPESIVKKEILPHIAKDPGYLAKENMVETDTGGFRQRPGPSNSLGLVKFEVQDEYAIYLHDTPSKRLFNKFERHLSHGCIRVDGAVDFARFLLAGDPAALATFDAAEASGDTTRVPIGRTIPVRLLYWTAFMNGDNRVAFRKDAYGRDSRLGEALGVGALSFTASDRDKTDDVGP